MLEARFRRTYLFSPARRTRLHGGPITEYVRKSLIRLRRPVTSPKAQDPRHSSDGRAVMQLCMVLTQPLTTLS